MAKSKEKASPTAPPGSFESLKPKLSDGVLDYVKAQGFTRMTPVQAATLPLFCHGHKDVAVQAVTGSGKSLCFLIPIVEHLLRRKQSYKRTQIGALILSPTRELAQQSWTVAKELSASCNLSEPLLLVGGSSNNSNSSQSQHRPVTQDLERFQQHGSDILIGTPGRVHDVLTRYAIDTSELEYLILDEADVLLNMGFATTIQNILSRLPKMRRTGLFSATTSTSNSTTSSLQEWMLRAGMRNPVWIDVAVTAGKDRNETNASSLTSSSSKSQATPRSLTNYYVVSPLDEKLSRLVAFLQSHRDEKIIVFFLTCACVEFYGTVLQQILPEHDIELLHGKLVQKRREKTMERFATNHGGGALFCTDVAARGLDVSDIAWVVQMDAPQDPSFYVHRVGRCARAGKSGRSLVFLTRKEEAYVDFLHRRQVPLTPLPSSELCCPPEDEDDDDKKKKSKPTATANDEETLAPQRTIRSASDPNVRLEDVLVKVRELVLKDRDVLEKGTKAFTSYVRAYKEHHCAFIFRYASLDLGLLATSFCLLRLPKMPEMRDVLQKHKGRLPRFRPAGPEVDIFAIPFKDKAREQSRQKRLEQELARGGKNAKLIKAEKRKADKERKAKERRQAAIEKGRNPDKKRGRNQQIVDEWDALAKEERLVKKLRRGKITKEEFDEQLYGV